MADAKKGETLGGSAVYAYHISLLVSLVRGEEASDGRILSIIKTAFTFFSL